MHKHASNNILKLEGKKNNRSLIVEGGHRSTSRSELAEVKGSQSS